MIDAHSPAAMKGTAAVIPPGERCALSIRYDGLRRIHQPQVNKRVPGVALSRGDMGCPDECGWVPHVSIGRSHIEVAS